MKIDPLESVARAHMTALREGRTADAYAYGSAAFRDTVPLERFELFLERFPVFGVHARAVFETRFKQDGRGFLQGYLETEQGTRVPVQFGFVHESDRWAIQSIDTVDADTHKRALGADVLSFDAVRLGTGLTDEPDVSIETDRFKRSDNISIVGTLLNVEAGTELSASFYHLDQRREISGTTIRFPETQNNYRFYFTFERDAAGLMTGAYEARLSARSLSGERVDFSVPFTVE